MGLDGEVCLCIKQGLVQKLMRRLRLGRFSYILFGLVRLIMAKPSRGYIILDRVKKIEFNHIYFISAHIHPFEGGGFCFAPGADAGDGKLSVCVVSHANKRKLLNTLIAALLRRKKIFGESAVMSVRRLPFIWNSRRRFIRTVRSAGRGE